MTAETTNINITACDYSDQSHRRAVVDLINVYINDGMGGGVPLTEAEQAGLIEGLSTRPSSIVLLAVAGGEYVGLLVAFENFSTFTARPMVNIHDVIVRPDYRGRGVGRMLLDGIIAEAASRRASRVTLEVRKDNRVAQSLYRSLGFEAVSPDMYYWRKYLE
ncbi:MAG: GNAT family N-acetyltransferase [Tannerellaceae bacterium]|jgi:ribosomal protein S18 acetylase RimI-like enzyme|nr:GNAT family N-acetyltransferase [Tannerellaceae bacterium]